MQDLIAMADRALRQAKAAGRDRVCPDAWTPSFNEAGAETRRMVPELVSQTAR